ncbi:CSMD [Mytilus coruscus]|uniref:CSMD n=1 Tax=Mytilus coruscus TaxID=42192 RepID=A0A6J8EDW8_MYTCO|nr:CSMD [Mytilus coruscus]
MQFRIRFHQVTQISKANIGIWENTKVTIVLSTLNRFFSYFEIIIISVPKCEEPEKVANANKSVVGSTILGTKVIYTCKTGYQHTKGNLTRSCQKNATWNGTAPICLPKCEEPEKVANANKSVAGITIFGTKVIYTCKIGYQHTKGDLTRSCQKNGTWDGTTPICLIKCEEPENVANAKRNVIGSPILGSKVVYTCKTGYQHTKGDLTRSCQKDGTWNGIIPICRK